MDAHVLRSPLNIIKWGNLTRRGNDGTDGLVSFRLRSTNHSGKKNEGVRFRSRAGDSEKRDFNRALSLGVYIDNYFEMGVAPIEVDSWHHQVE